MKKIILVISLFIAILIINNLAHSIYNIWQKQDLVVNIEQELAHEKQMNAKLKQELEHVKKKEFVEEEARNKLFLVKPGEQVVLIPSNTLSQSSVTPTPSPKIPNWQQWWEVFF